MDWTIVVSVLVALLLWPLVLAAMAAVVVAPIVTVFRKRSQRMMGAMMSLCMDGFQTMMGGAMSGEEQASPPGDRNAHRVNVASCSGVAGSEVEHNVART